MSPDQLCVPPGVPGGCRFTRVEIDRLQWWVGDGGDPASLLEAFCDNVGFAVGDLSRYGEHDPLRPLCGVALLVSAAAGAVMIGGAPGPASPAPGVPDVVAVAYRHGPAATAVPSADPARLGDWVHSWQSGEHAAAVSAVRAAIGRGDVYQVNIVSHRYADFDTAELASLARLSTWPGARFAGIMAGPGWSVASASPECLADVAGGMVETAPIKGTAVATEAGARELRASVKERAEHIMIVDLERNDLAHVAVPGTIEVADLFTLGEWGGLWQAESRVRARLAARTSLAQLLAAVCPPGSVTGTPKLAALEHIAVLEAVGRGPAMGAMGYLTAAGLRMGLTIRTVATHSRRAHLWAGGGITWRSDPDAEVSEAEAKAKPLVTALAGG